MIYLTHHNFRECAKNLHTEELREQIADMYNMITKEQGNKEDFLLWKFQESKLTAYWVYSIKEYLQRKEVDKEEKKRIVEAMKELEDLEVNTGVPFFMEEKHLWSKHLLMSYRVFLLRKRPKFYKEKYPKLYKNLDKYPKELFYITLESNEECKKANKKWEKVMPVECGFAAFENGKDVTQKFLEKEDEE